MIAAEIINNSIDGLNHQGQKHKKGKFYFLRGFIEQIEIRILAKVLRNSVGIDDADK